MEQVNWIFYKTLYKDLCVLKDEIECKNHYYNHGIHEKRVCNYDQIINNYKKVIIPYIHIKKEETSHLLYILIRTSNRPQYFRMCINSILLQENISFQNIRIIVSYDNNSTLEYLKKYIQYYTRILHITIVNCCNITSASTCPYNLYFNILFKYIQYAGWILF